MRKPAVWIETRLRHWLHWESCPFFAWACAAVVLAIVLLILWSTSAAAQTLRGESPLQEVLRATPDPARGAARSGKSVARGRDIFMQQCVADLRRGSREV